jgi:outer membrane protein insertion porin family
VRVEPKIIELPNQRVDLIFEVQEGARTGIKKIVFVGNKAYSSQRLKQVIKSGETNFLSFLLSNDLYDPDRMRGGPESTAALLSQSRLSRHSHRLSRGDL